MAWSLRSRCCQLNNKNPYRRIASICLGAIEFDGASVLSIAYWATCGIPIPDKMTLLLVMKLTVSAAPSPR